MYACTSGNWGRPGTARSLMDHRPTSQIGGCRNRSSDAAWKPNSCSIMPCPAAFFLMLCRKLGATSRRPWQSTLPSLGRDGGVVGTAKHHPVHPPLSRLGNILLFYFSTKLHSSLFALKHSSTSLRSCCPRLITPH